MSVDLAEWESLRVMGQARATLLDRAEGRIAPQQLLLARYQVEPGPDGLGGHTVEASHPWWSGERSGRAFARVFVPADGSDAGVRVEWLDGAAVA